MALPKYTETRYRIWHYIYLTFCTGVFILAIGYYITPALVGGASGTLTSNQIAFHMKSTLDWSFASAMGLMLLVGVLAIYWVYNKLVGVDNIKLG